METASAARELSRIDNGVNHLSFKMPRGLFYLCYDTYRLESCIRDLQLLDGDIKGSRLFLTRFVGP